MNYYHIDKQALTIISGPHAEKSAAIKKLASCGNPELLDLSAYDLVPEVVPVLLADQVHTVDRVVSLTEVTWGVRDLTPAEVADNAASKLQSDLQQATISSAILITEVFNQLNVSGALDASALSQKAKDEFATLTALVNSYIP